MKSKMCKRILSVLFTVILSFSVFNITDVVSYSAGYVIIRQGDYRNVSYPSNSRPSGTISSSGCGVCSALMVIRNTTTYSPSVKTFTKEVIDCGGRIDGGTDMLKVAKMMKKKYGFKYTTTKSIAVLKRHLQKGYMATEHVGNKYIFTPSGGHFVTIAGITSVNGQEKAIVLDPAGSNARYKNAKAPKNLDYSYNEKTKISTASFDVLKQAGKGEVFVLFTPTNKISLPKVDNGSVYGQVVSNGGTFPLTIDTDGNNGNPYHDPYWQNTTSSGTDATKIPFVVVPGRTHKLFGQSKQAKEWIGYLCSVYDPKTKKTVYGIVGDVGPQKKPWAEVSDKMAKMLGYSGGNNSCPKAAYIITVYNKKVTKPYTINNINKTAKSIGQSVTVYNYNTTGVSTEAYKKLNDVKKFPYVITLKKETKQEFNGDITKELSKNKSSWRKKYNIPTPAAVNNYDSGNFEFNPSISNGFFNWPVPSNFKRISADFFHNSGSHNRVGGHGAIDIPVPTGTPVYAAAEGTVIRAGWGNGYGNVVYIDHHNGFITIYGHNSKLLVTNGQNVARGQIIAKAGSTGHSTGPHCHFEVRKNGIKVNPQNYL